jgi:glycerophosphoryl diester phosphodiesterase
MRLRNKGQQKISRTASHGYCQAYTQRGFEACENHPTPHGSPIQYNIEVKSREEWDGVFHPPVDEYVDLFIRFMDSVEFMDRITIQSFDMRVLRILHAKRPDWKLSLLVDNFWPMRYNVKQLGFKPAVYSPYFKRVTKRSISKAKVDGVKLIPWTVNEISDMQRLIDMGVDGLITDYPNRLVELVGSTGSSQE